MSAEVIETPKRMRIVIRGAVQGVGFRPFIYRLANDLRLSGWVKNSSNGVAIEIEGEKERLERFLLRIEPEKPPRSSIQGLEYSYLDPVGYTAFEILASDQSGAKMALVLPDIATCPDCLTEIFDPDNRRYLYPFTNCTNCGPRYTIITALPYDRPDTTMSGFTMCKKCRAEYDNPDDRRFHAQPNACPDCGPHLELWDAEGKIISKHHEALLGAVDVICGGRIVAVKGIGGFHLNELSSPLLGVAWDGAGYGLDGTIWGGEFFRVTEGGFERAAYFRPFRLPGGEKAIKEPRRAALAALYEIFGDSLLDRRDIEPIDSFSGAELKVLINMLEKSINSPYTTSAGRLFDVVSSIIGIRQATHFEGQAAMELEFLLDPNQTTELYRFEFEKAESAIIVDWRPMILDLLDDLKSGVPVARISAKFHNTMSEIIVAIAQLANEKKVALSGGCFQNKYLTERTIVHLIKAGFQLYWHQRIPPNDGGISLGQAVAVIDLKNRAR